MLDWQDLAVGFALYLVLEGVLPFLSPGTMRGVFQRFLAMSDGQLRFAGLLSMLGGLIVLWLARS